MPPGAEKRAARDSRTDEPDRPRNHKTWEKFKKYIQLLKKKLVS